MREQTACILVVRLTGTVADSVDIESTMAALMLERKFEARLLRNDESILGMLRKVQALVAWGEPEPATVTALLLKRAERIGGSVVDEDFVKMHFHKGSVSDLAASLVSGDIPLSDLWRTGLKPHFRLHPPKGGFKRSTRRVFGDGGELGYRGGEINSLLRRMI